MRPAALPPPAVVTAVVLAVAGSGLIATGLARDRPPPVPASSTGSPASSTGSPAWAAWSPAAAAVPARSAPAQRDADQRDVAMPVALEIPRIGVRASISAVGRDPDGAIAVPPPDAASAAGAYWYRDLVPPGATGPAVIVGHVDTWRDGPAVFYRLGELAAGDLVTIRRADGSTARFVVHGVARYPKAGFPTDTVYGPTTVPALRLITCGGVFDRRRGSYLDNVVVFATLAGTVA